MRARFVVVWLGVVLVVPALGAAQGLGGAAKKEKQRLQASKPGSAKEFTQADLERQGGASSATATPAPAAAGDSRAETDATGSSESRGSESLDAEGAARQEDEAQWRGRVAMARRRVDVARRAHDTLASMTLVPGYEYVDDSGRIVIHTIEQLQALTARAKASLDAAEQELARLLEEARRANVPPGWLR